MRNRRKIDTKRLEEEAMRRRLQHTASDQDQSDTDQLNNWLSESPTNMRVYKSADWFCNVIDGLGEDTREALIERYRSAGSYPLKQSWWRQIHVQEDWRMIGAMVATFAAIVFGIWWMTFEPYTPDYATKSGEVRIVALPDGSSVELNTDSAIAVEMIPERRRILLLRGEAFFKVAPDATRPFEVLAANVRARALGTAFNIRKEGVTATVSVQEHVVRVTSDDNGTSRDVGEGEQVRVTPDGTIAPTEHYNESHLLAWRRNRLVVENRPLPEVINELNRYRSGYIIAVDPMLSSLAVTASFDITRPDEALLLLQTILPIRIYSLTTRLVFLTRA